MNTLIICLTALCFVAESSGYCQEEVSLSDSNEPSTTELFITTELASTTGPSIQDGSNELDNVAGPTESLLRKRRKVQNQAAKFSKLMALVKASNLQDCAGRVVCDLNCDPHKHGSDGKRVLNNLEKLQTSGQIKERDLEFYIRAAVVGRKYRKPKTCDKCGEDYPNCPSQVSDMVAVASLIKLTS